MVEPCESRLAKQSHSLVLKPWERRHAPSHFLVLYAIDVFASLSKGLEARNLDYHYGLV